MSVTG
jgi:Plasma-membrane choline transporter